MNYSTIIRSVAHYVPARRVTNDDLSKLMDTSDEWIRERTGIHERRFIEDASIKTSDLGEQAARLALKRANWEPKSLDYIVVATLSPDYYFPGVGTMLQHRLGCSTIPALDIRVQCSGFVYGLSCIDALIKAGQASRVLLVCAEVQSPVLDFTTRGREMSVLFGDGAGALILEGVETKEAPQGSNIVRGVIDSFLGSDGSGADALCLKTPGTATPGFLRKEDIEAGLVHPQMEGRLVFKSAVHHMLQTAEKLLARNQMQTTDISLLVPHQANHRISESIREHLKLDPQRVWNNIHKYGNTTAATIPICLSEAAENGALKEGDIVMTLAFGAGFTWGGNLLRW